MRVKWILGAVLLLIIGIGLLPDPPPHPTAPEPATNWTPVVSRAAPAPAQQAIGAASPKSAASRHDDQHATPNVVTGALAGALVGESTGLEWKAARSELRSRWATAVARRFETEPMRIVALAVGLRACIDETVTGDTAAEARQLDRITAQVTLSDLTALCLVGLGADAG